MELWIRSQDKRVFDNVKGFCITHSDENKWNILNVDTTTRYGTYDSEERALEILDEIEYLIKPRFLVSNISINGGKRLQNQIPYKNDMIQTTCDSKIEQINGSIVYEMPEE